MFEKCLHKYVIVDAIRDENVLRFAVEYVGTYRRKETSNEIDINVEDIDTKEVMESEIRLGKITDYILAHHNAKTRNREFTAMFCVGSVDMLIKYYNLFKDKQTKLQQADPDYKPLRIATIFTYAANEADKAIRKRLTAYWMKKISAFLRAGKSISPAGIIWTASSEIIIRCMAPAIQLMIRKAFTIITRTLHNEPKKKGLISCWWSICSSRDLTARLSIRFTLIKPALPRTDTGILPYQSYS